VPSPAPSRSTLQPAISSMNVTSARSPAPSVQTQAPATITSEVPSMQNEFQTSNQNQAPILSIFNDGVSKTAPPTAASERVTNTLTSSCRRLTVSLFFYITSIVCITWS
jgi:hypothetical protein